MVNPYEPPKGIAPKSFRKRFMKALAMAAAEYRAGLKRDGLNGWPHLQAWLQLIVTALLVLLITVAAAVLALVNSGMLSFR